MDTLAPAELVQRCQHRLPEDPRAFELLVRHYKQSVFATAYRMMGNRDEAEDQAQEAFLKIYRGIKELDDPTTLTSWIYRVTINTCLDALRREKRSGPRLFLSPNDEQDTALDEFPDTEQPTPEESVLRAEVRRCLEETLTRLDSTSRAILVLRDIEDRPYDEIAKILGLGLSAIKMRIHRTRLAFQELLTRVCPDLGPQGSSRPI